MSLGVLHQLAKYLRRDRRVYSGVLQFKDGAISVTSFKGAVTATYNAAGDVTFNVGIRPRLAMINVLLPPPAANTGACAVFLKADTAASDGNVQINIVEGADFTTKVDPANDKNVYFEIITEGEAA